jgi:hypothetical protein
MTDSTNKITKSLSEEVNELFWEKRGRGREFERIRRICEKLERVWSLNPDQRLGQLLQQHVPDNFIDRDTGIRDLFYVEDDILEEWLDKQLQLIYDAKGCGRD